MDIFDKRCDIKIQQIKPKAEHLKTFPNLVLHDENAFLVIFRVAMFTRVILQAIPFILVRKAFTFWLEKLLPFAIIRFPFFPTMYFQGIFGKKDIDLSQLLCIITAVQTWKGFNTLWFCGQSSSRIQTLKLNLNLNASKLATRFGPFGQEGSKLGLQLVLRQMTSTCKEKLTRTTVRCCSDTLWKKRATFIPSSTMQTKRKMRKKGIMTFPLARVSCASPSWTRTSAWSLASPSPDRSHFRLGGWASVRASAL